MRTVAILRLDFRDKYRSLFGEEFQSWVEKLLRAKHPTGDFQSTRRTQGDGGLDGFIISSQHAYAMYAPERRNELRDSETARKIRSDFTKAYSTLDGKIKAWTFVHNQPSGRLGKKSLAAISELKSQNPKVEITVLNINTLWKKLRTLRRGTLERFVGAKSEQIICAHQIAHAAAWFVGRKKDLERLNKAWSNTNQNVLIIPGFAGQGKSSLVIEWRDQLAQRSYDGASYYEWPFTNQATDGSPPPSETFIAAALEFFGGEEGKKLANGPGSALYKVTPLLEYIRRRRTLLVLDGLEVFQYLVDPLAGRLRDPAMSALLKGLAQKNPGLCVVTTRVTVTDLEGSRHTVQHWGPLEPLSDREGATLLRRLLEPPKKTVHKVRSTIEQRKEISHELKGHALTLRLLGGYIHKALRDVRRWREVDYSKADAEYVPNLTDTNAGRGHAFKTIEAYEHWFKSIGPRGARQHALVRLLGLFDSPASEASIAALRATLIPGLTDPLCGITDEELNSSLSELEECGLVAPSKSESFLDSHLLIREYYALQLRTELPDAWRTAHHLLYQHLCTTTRDKTHPTLDDLQPLYQAVAHGCKAEIHQEAFHVYRDRILRGTEGDGYYSTKCLGAYGTDLRAVAHFFHPRSNWVSPVLTNADDQAFLLRHSAYCLRALGRMKDAVKPMRAALNLYLQQEQPEWKYVASSSAGLSELELTLGNMAEALGESERCIEYADRSPDAAEQIAARCTRANVLKEAGKLPMSRGLFEKAATMQEDLAKTDFTLPPVKRRSTFAVSRYCDLLLIDVEREAWRCWEFHLRAVGRSSVQSINGSLDSVGSSGMSLQRGPRIQLLTDIEHRCHRARENATQRGWLLAGALDLLTLVRVSLYRGLLESRNSHLASTLTDVNLAVEELSESSRVDQLPLGLLTRAWLLSLTGARTDRYRAKRDLDDAWEIAVREPMPLFQADILLHRARHFGGLKDERGRSMKYLWKGSPQADLAKARSLIADHGYWRLKGQLEDAEAAAKNWPVST